MGSDSILVTKVLANKLDSRGENQPLTLSKVAYSSTRTMSKLVNSEISSLANPFKISISNIWVI